MSFHAALPEPSLSHPFQPTRLSQNSQPPGFVLGMPRKLLLSPEAGAGEQGHEIPSVSLMAPIIMTDVLTLPEGSTE